MNKEQRKYYDQGYRAGQKKTKKEAFDKGWQSAHDEFEDHLKTEHYERGKKDGWAAAKADFKADAKSISDNLERVKDNAYQRGKKDAMADVSGIVASEDRLKRKVAEMQRELASVNVGKIREEAYAKGCEDARAEYDKTAARKYEEGLAEGKRLGFEEGEAKTYQTAKAEGYELAKKDMHEYYKDELVNRYNKGVIDNSKKMKAFIANQQAAWNCKETALNRKIKGLWALAVSLVASAVALAWWLV